MEPSRTEQILSARLVGISDALNKACELHDGLVAHILNLKVFKRVTCNNWGEDHGGHLWTTPESQLWCDGRGPGIAVTGQAT